ncbi:hypothetical protein OEZ85_013881 [Tetradesmus obliquus]|uniref:Fungal lipase-type domain-containing protein n=1 Tax=Tetradesmus obliquus TaxID=3088 RepID=A0ABY8U6D9_TETOB|nr:hypothetical protein OEZ85_013881 [Tetradesmus obliquus]
MTETRSFRPRRALLQDIEQQASKKPNKNDIPMAPKDVLQQSLFAANLSALAYPGTLLTSNSDVENTYTSPDSFQQYATALAAATASFSSHAPTFVQRLSQSFRHPETSARFLYAFVLPTNDAIYVAFRGTDLTGYFDINAGASTGEDANSLQTPFSYGGAAAGNVHSGFLLSLTDVNVDSYNNDSFPNSISAYTELVAAIKAAQAAVGPSVPIILTGHSLGAAQASLAGFMLSRDGFSNLRLATFGCPQIGDAEWAAAFNATLGSSTMAWWNMADGSLAYSLCFMLSTLGSSTMAWWNMTDPVVQVPNIDEDPGCGNFGSHTDGSCVQNWFTVATRYRIDTVNSNMRCGKPSGSFAVCDSRSDSKFPANTLSCYTDVDLKTAFLSTDHYISHYIANLQACVTAAGGN